MLYRRVEENLRAAMRCYARVSEHGESRDYPGVTVTSSGIPCAVFNSAMLTEPATEPDFKRLLHLSAMHFGQRRLGWTLWLCEDMLGPDFRTDVRSMLRADGMCVIAEPPGMYTEQLTVPKKQAPLDIRPVNSETTRMDFAYLSSQIFSLPLETAKMVYGAAKLWDDAQMRGWVGYYNSHAVSIATVVIGAGVAGVYSVGTLPVYQGRGFAEALVRYALNETRKDTGVEATVLQSTSQGMSLYLRMGYRVVTRFAVYLREGNGPVA